jgi:hypothetical protein
VQALRGHPDVFTTMIDTHVLKVAAGSTASPLDAQGYAMRDKIAINFVASHALFYWSGALMARQKVTSQVVLSM